MNRSSFITRATPFDMPRALHRDAIQASTMGFAGVAGPSTGRYPSAGMGASNLTRLRVRG